MENIKVKIWIGVFSIVVPLLITIAGNYFGNQLALARMDERIATIRESNARHELERGQDIQRLLSSKEDHAQRIVRLEASLDAIHVVLSELKEDIKILIKARHQ